MESTNMKALYIVVNAGFAEQVVDYIRSQGSTGATIINARGVSALHKEIMGISVDTEKEVVLTVTESEIADKIMEAIKLPSVASRSLSKSPSSRLKTKTSTPRPFFLYAQKRVKPFFLFRNFFPKGTSPLSKKNVWF